jgi:hypothetical protein
LDCLGPDQTGRTFADVNPHLAVMLNVVVRSGNFLADVTNALPDSVTVNGHFAGVDPEAASVAGCRCRTRRGDQ